MTDSNKPQGDTTINSELRMELNLTLYQWTESDDIVKELADLILPLIAQEANKAVEAYRDEVLALIDKHKVRDGEALHVIGAELLAHEVKQLQNKTNDGGSDE